ncbi:ROK family protein [Planotetraspora sp. GP83]|uniref:ROK family protein n=1 Tax=Planotetraspora sp. GP83 TaxID=3156264 RepID=UPI0035146325
MAFDGRLVAAIDFGGTKIAAGIVAADGTVLRRAVRPTPADEPAETVMGAVAGALADLMGLPEWRSVEAVGIGSAGPVDVHSGTVSPVNVPAWRDFPLLDRVAALAGPLPVRLIGDGVAIAAAEHRYGAARGRPDALCVTVSTGIGGGLVLGGRVHQGPSGNAGHVGHIVVDPTGEPCPCGARGCVETIASGPAITRWALRNGWSPSADGTGTSTDVVPTAAGVAASAMRGDPVAVAVFQRAADALAVAVAATAAVTDIRVVVVGGGVAQAGAVLLDPLRQAVRAHATLTFTHGIEILPAALGSDTGLVGAAAAVQQETA